MSFPLISVIVPIYNMEKYLNRCIDSIVKQSYTNLEIILVNDGSTDSSLDICYEYQRKDTRVKIVNKKNGGLSSARNAGLDVAKGEYIGFVDSDDYIAEEMYEKLYTSIKDTEGVVSNIRYVRALETGSIYPSAVPHNCDCVISKIKFLEELLLHIGDVSVCSKLFPKDVIGSNRFEEGKLNEDLLFMLQIINNVESINFLGHVGYFYFVRENSISSGYGKAVIDMQDNSLRVLNCVNSNFPQLKEQAMRFALYQNMAYLLLIPSEKTKNNSNFLSAKKFIRKNIFKAIFNRYLKFKKKIIIISLCLFPKKTAKRYQKKRGV